VSNWKERLWRVPGVRRALSFRSQLWAQSFDWRHGVKTCGEEDPRTLTVVGDNVANAGLYIPTTPRAGRHILRDLPIADFSTYTFIDMGSGKGRMLLLAAEQPFRRIVGVEFASDLHALAQTNVRRYRNSKQVCFNIESVHMDAMQYQFPTEPLLLYFFYPFHQEVMEQVIQNLDRSLGEHPRDVILVYHNPVLSSVVEAASHLHLYAMKSHFSVHYGVFRSIL
jgi:SAM-dependent methyltransferase